MKLQPRDLEIFASLNKYGVLTTKQLGAAVFKNIATTTILRRLRKLEALDYVYRITGLEGGELVWGLARHGAFAIHEEPPYRFTNKNVLFHEVALSSVRLTLELVGLGAEWIRDKDLYRMKEHHGRRRELDREVLPDGFFMASISGEHAPVALELELTAKGRQRYEKLLYEYSRKSELTLLWYIVGDDKLAALLKREWRRVNFEGGSPRLAITSLDELLRNPRAATMEFSNGQKRRILDVFDLPKEIKKSSSQAALGVSNLDTRNFENRNEVKHAQIEEKTAAPEFKVSRPFTVDHSPSTSDGEWSALTGKELVSGAEKQEKECA
jgi:hypothetical protein